MTSMEQKNVSLEATRLDEKETKQSNTKPKSTKRSTSRRSNTPYSKPKGQGSSRNTVSALLREQMMKLKSEPASEWWIGVDEVGRGCLAGDAYVAAARLEAATNLSLPANVCIFDSKRIKRWIPSTYQWLSGLDTTHCTYSIVPVSVHDIDTMNILQAILQGMYNAVKQVVDSLRNLSKDKIIRIWVDGTHIPQGIQSMCGSDPNLFVECLPKGDQTYQCIAAASILAKYTRDRYMSEAVHPQYTSYGFDRHKGYGSKLHMDAIRRYGPTSIHRKSFRMPGTLDKVVDKPHAEEEEKDPSHI